MKILLTNDDGLMAPGLQALRHALREVGEVTAVAPDSGRSATAHAITFNEPIYAEQVAFADGTVGVALAANPADCVKFALTEVLAEPPELIVSGINDGENTGINVFYSGTVSAAMEGGFLGFTSVAVSFSRAGAAGGERDFATAAGYAVGVIWRILEHRPPAGLVLNVNVPAQGLWPPKGVRVVPHCTKGYVDRFERRVAPSGRPYFWMTGAPDYDASEAGTDNEALAAGYITVTPLLCDLTRHDLLDALGRWQWEGCP